MTTMERVTPSEAIELLSSMYLCKPSREVVENWKRALAGDSSIFLADLKKATIDVDVAAEKEMEDLLWDYTRLFIGPYKLPCPPWESVYTSPKKLMMQEAADQALRLYEEAGLAINTADIMPDHIGAELNFLAVLLQKMQSGNDGNGRYMRIMEKFLNDHLVKWMPEFTRDMEDAAESSFYKALAGTTRAVVDFVGR